MEWSAERFSEFATGYWSAAALIAAVELRLFDAIPPTGAASLETLAAAVGGSPQRVGPLLEALAACEVLVKSGDTYAIMPSARPWLVRSSPTCLLDALAYNADLYGRWARLADVVRGADPPAGHASMPPDAAVVRRFVRAMEAKARVFSPAIAPHIDLAGATSLLDVGSGPGTLSRILAGRYENLRVTLLDLPTVMGEVRTLCAECPTLNRLTFHPADYHADDLPRGHDAILYAGALHQESFTGAERLFEKFQRALNPGGRLLIVDLMLDADRAAPAFASLFQLNMLLIRPGSRVFSVAEVTEMLQQQGWHNVESIVADSCYRIVTATT